VFTTRPSQSFSISLYGIYVFAQYIYIFSIVDQELIYSSQFQSFLIFLDLPDGIFKAVAIKHLPVSDHSE
jgi:hypothetical protein